MSTLPEGFTFQGIYCYRDEKDETNFYCLPQEPSPERDSFGHPVLNLFVTDEQALLQLSLRWDLDRNKLLALKQALAEKYNILTPDSIQLSIPAVTVKEVRLEVGDGSGKFDTLQVAQSSGFPPFSTVFNLQINNTQKANVMAALHGRENFLVGRYLFSLPMEGTFTAHISGDVSEQLTELLENKNDINIPLLIDEAIAEGKLSFTQQETAPVTDELKTKVTNLAKAKAAAVLEEMVSESTNSSSSFTNNLINESAIDVSASLSETIAASFKSSTDISTWLVGENVTDFIRIMPSTVDHSTTQQTSNVKTAVDLTVSLSFIPKDIPVDFIQLICNTSQATMRSPEFAPVTLSAAEASEPVHIKTNYTDGGQVYESMQTHPQTQEWKLEPVYLGLACITLDGRALQEEKVKSARVHIRYQPSGNGTEDDRTIYLQNEEWFIQWYIVTRSHELAGELTYEAKLTTADGSMIKHPRMSISEPLIKLELSSQSNSTNH